MYSPINFEVNRNEDLIGKLLVSTFSETGESQEIISRKPPINEDTPSAKRRKIFPEIFDATQCRENLFNSQIVLEKDSDED